MKHCLFFCLVTLLALTACDQPANSGGSVLEGTVSLSGTAETGQTLAADTANLQGSGTVSYQWQRADTSDGTFADIADANGQTYILTNEDIGKYIRVTVSIEGYTGSKSSAATGPVAGALPTLEGTVSLSGTAETGQTLAADTANLQGSGTVSYQWQRAGMSDGTFADIADATGATYTLTNEDIGKYIRVTVNRAGHTGTVNSAATGPVMGTPPAKPTASLAAGAYTEVQTISLSGDGDAEIWYTTDGGEPAKEAGTKYTEPFRLNRTCALKAVAVKNGATPSEVLIVEYTINVPLTWTMVAIPPFTPLGFALAYGNGTFVAGGAKKLAYSTDGGISWPLVDPQPLTAGNIRGVAFGNGTFVAGGKGETAWSTDGVEWTKSDDNEFGTEYIYSVAFGNNTFVAVGAKGKIAYSTDNGKTWEAVGTSQFAANENINGLAWGGGRFIAAGAAGKTAYSNDGITWSAGPVLQNPTSGSPVELAGIAYGNGAFVLTSPGHDGYVAYSTDQGGTWTAVTPAPGSNIKIPSVAWGGGRFVVGSNGGHIIWSVDGREWTDTLWLDGLAVAPVVNNIAYGKGRFVAVGNQLGPGNVTIMYSNEQE